MRLFQASCGVLTVLFAGCVIGCRYDSLITVDLRKCDCEKVAPKAAASKEPSAPDTTFPSQNSSEAEIEGAIIRDLAR